MRLDEKKKSHRLSTNTLLSVYHFIISIAENIEKCFDSYQFSSFDTWTLGVDILQLKRRRSVIPRNTTCRKKQT